MNLCIIVFNFEGTPTGCWSGSAYPASDNIANDFAANNLFRNGKVVS